MAEKTFTKAELAKFDGKNGNKAYVAIDGAVYDVTNVPQWAEGQHHGHVAGHDLSEAITKAPHKKSVLQKLTVVGKYSAE
ncbi:MULTISPECIES: cytochrome b5 domain-containing protein [Loigolactobacillus]|uniref:Cytochrome b5 domain-containing protein n=1 Tax=Loigolactobacillus jiayinensis TaxID=2486016 RepID=A0ABW1REA6_9LACO|nr:MULTISPECIES: cytochrome b5 domain-containing protein [Loigolactobacillus]MDA5388757.1 cytochrome B5 [Loigolactobacillus backii]MDA5391249.1 cytochrome B5 [Loigolactobacillus backii]